MKIAFTHNLKLTDSEHEAEFDTPETVQKLKNALLNLGHHVDRVEVGGPVSQTVAKLEALRPDIIFNTAEGQHGRFREGFFPGVFEQLGIPFTGSDAYVCTLTLDKNLCKKVVHDAGVLTPQSFIVTDIDDLEVIQLRYPLILKPNYEGSSKGITKDSIVETEFELFKKLKDLLPRYKSGILVEEYIDGIDIAVPFIEGVSSKTKGVLPPIYYTFAKDIMESRKFPIYDYELKNKYSDKVDVHLLKDIPKEVMQLIYRTSSTVFECLGLRDIGRIDYRLTKDHRLYFIEVNALPSLEPGAGIYLSAKEIGLENPEDVLEKVLKNACLRSGIEYTKKTKHKIGSKLRVGFAFNQKRIKPSEDPNTDMEAEYDAPTTLNAIREAIASYGHEVIDLEADADFAYKVSSAAPDVVFNIAEGIHGRNRESQVPAILELLSIPYTGSDPTTLSIALDKGLAKRIVRDAGILTAKFQTFFTGKEKISKDLRYPLIVKPLAEGSSKGVLENSVASNEKELRDLILMLIKKYHQAALVEEFLPGREFTVGLIGEYRPKVLPPMEIVFLKKELSKSVYTYQHKLDTKDEVRYDNPALLDPKLKSEIEKVSKAAFTALGCRDFARIDLRLDGEGRVCFIECNPLPGLTPDWSDLCLIANSAKIEYRALIGEILSPAIRRYKEKMKLLLRSDHEGTKNTEIAKT